MKLKKTLAAALACGLALALLAGCGGSGSSSVPAVESTSTPAAESLPEEPETTEPDTSDAIAIEIVLRDYGTITAELYPNEAPITVQNFVDLATGGFYDGLTFHRIIEGFMIQGGGPNGNSTGGSASTIKGEFATNGVANSLAHTRGVLSMARSKANDSASSQFFIMHEASPHLDGDYAAFGMVTDGMDIVDAIVADAVISGANGAVAPEDQPVIETIRVIAE